MRMKFSLLLTYCIVLSYLSTSQAAPIKFLESKNESVLLTPDFQNDEDSSTFPESGQQSLSTEDPSVTYSTTRPLFIPLTDATTAMLIQRQEVAATTGLSIPSAQSQLSVGATLTESSSASIPVVSTIASDGSAASDSSPSVVAGSTSDLADAVTPSLTAVTDNTAASEPLLSTVSDLSTGMGISPATGLTALTDEEDMATGYGQTTESQNLPLPIASLYPSTTMAMPTYDPSDVNSALYTCFENSQLSFSTPRDPDFGEKLRVWNLVSDTQPVAYLTPFTDTQVSEAVRCAVGNNRTVTARGGGHSYIGASRGQTGGVTLDLKYMDEVVLGGEIAYIGAGARMGTVYYQLWQQGKRLVPGGTCPQVGAVGLTMGGGQGVASRKYGLMSDNVIEYNVVLADGEIVRASLEENPRLFWALRGGGGGNFGIVTRMTILTHKPPEKVSAYQIQIPLNLTGSFIREILEFAKTAPPEFGGYFGMASLGVGGYLTYMGPLRDLEYYAYNLLKQWASPVTATPIETDWLNLYYQVSQTTFPTSSLRRLELTPDFEQPSVYSQIKSLMVQSTDTIPPLVVQALQLQVTVGNPAVALINVELMGGNINAVSPDATAFVHRNEILLIEPTLTSSQPLTPADELWLTGIYDLLLPYATGGSYVNFADGNLPRPGAAFYGSNFDDLKILKEVWDPRNVFNFTLSLNNLDA